MLFRSLKSEARSLSNALALLPAPHPFLGAALHFLELSLPLALFSARSLQCVLFVRAARTQLAHDAVVAFVARIFGHEQIVGYLRQRPQNGVWLDVGLRILHGVAVLDRVGIHPREPFGNL